MDPEPAAFFSIEGLVAIAGVLAAVGKAADWLLLKQQKTELLTRVAAFGNYLSTIRFKRIQLDLVRALLAFLTALSVPWTVRKHPEYTSKADNDLDASEVFALMLGIFLRPFELLVSMLILALWAVGWLDFRYAGLLGAFAVVLLLRSVLWLLHLGAAGYELEPDPEVPMPPFLRWLEQSRVAGALSVLGPRMLVISFLLTVIALEVGMAYWQSPQTTSWFIIGEGRAAPSAPLTLALLNLPFDVLALITTIAMLRFALRKEVSISLVAIADICITVAIAFVLLVVLLAWPSWEPRNWLAAAEGAAQHLARAYTFAGHSEDSVFPLYPLLFTPFAPIAFYLLLPVFVAGVFAPLLRIAAHICSLLHQKEQSPFLVFAFAIAGTMAVVKVLTAWPWFADRMSVLFS